MAETRVAGRRTSQAAGRNRMSRWLLGGALVAASFRAGGQTPPAAPAPAVLADGAKVEVREGDTWSAATVVKREGRRYLIHYDGADAATDEWVTPDRVRARTTPAPGRGAVPPARGGVPAPASRPAAPAATKPAAPPVPVWNVGQKVEIKWGGAWRAASIVNRRGEWYLIKFEPGMTREWVEPWRVRKVGSKEDPYGYARPNGFVQGNEGPPTEKPGPPSEPFGGTGRGGSNTAAGARARGAQAADEAEKAPAKAPVIPTDRSGVRELILAGGSLGAPALTPDPGPKPAKPPAGQSVVLTAGTGGSFDTVTHVLIAPVAGVAAAIHTDGSPAPNPAPTRVELVDLAAGRAVTTTIPVPCDPLDISPDGKLLLSRSKGYGFGRGARLDVWQVGAPGEAKHVVSFLPYDNLPQNSSDVAWGRFIDADHVATRSSEGVLAVWAYRTAKAVWSSDVAHYVTPALSAGGKNLACVGKTGSVLVAEALTGKALGRIEGDVSSCRMLSFKPDGMQLAAAGEEQVFVWDTKTGDVAAELSPAGARGTGIQWLNDGFLLVDGYYVASLEKKLVVWGYQGVRADQGQSFAGRYWYAPEVTGRKTKMALASVPLPDNAARQATAGMKGGDALALYPGAQVSLEVYLPGDARDKAVQHLTQQLKANGVAVADGRPFKLIAKSDPGQMREMEYRTMGFGRGGNNVTKVSIQETKNTVALVDASGKVLWQRTAVNGPPLMLSVKAGQSVEAAVAEASKPNYGFFESVHVPAYVAKSGTAFGKSRLTDAGTLVEVKEK